MELALYCPDYGFYETERDNLGASGHFYTSVSVGPLFGELLAIQFAEWFEEAARNDLSSESGGIRCTPKASPTTVPGRNSQRVWSAAHPTALSPGLTGQSIESPKASPTTAPGHNSQSVWSAAHPAALSPGLTSAATSESPISHLPSPISYQLVESGAHDGRLALDILTWFATHRPDLLAQLEYCIIEPSCRRRQWQEKTLAKFGERVRWLPDFAAFPCHSTPATRHTFQIIFSNELLDAMPAHRLCWDAKAKQWYELGLTFTDSQFQWQRMAQLRTPDSGLRTPDPGLRTQGPGLRTQDSGLWTPDSGLRTQDSGLRTLDSGLGAVLPDGFILDICPAAELWWQDAARSLVRGKLLTLDYGLTSEELLLPERKDGTLRGYVRHRMTTDVLANPGQQDLTTHVNFSSIQAAGEAAGLRTEKFLTQERFLTEIVAQTSERQPLPISWTPARKRQFQTLTHPDLMGRRFCVLIQSR